MTKLRWAAAACVLFAAHLAAAQDPPPPMLPGDAPAPVPPAPPPVPPAPDAPPPMVTPSPAPPASPPPAYAPPPASPPPPAYPPPATFSPPPSITDAPPPQPQEAPEPVEPPASRDRRPGAAARSLKGYLFPTPALIDSAFLTTHVGLGVEVGHYWAYGEDPTFQMATSNGLNANGTDVPYDLSMGYTTEYFSLGIAPWEKFGLTLDGSYTSFVDSDINGAVFYGSQYQWDIRPGARFLLIRSPRTGTQLGLHVYADFNSLSKVNPQEAILSIASQLNTCLNDATTGTSVSCAPTVPASQTTYTSTQVSGGATLSLAQTAGSTLAFQLAMGTEVGYGWYNSFGSQINGPPVTFHIGAAPSFRLGRTIPITLMAEYLFTVGYTPTQGLVPSSTSTELTPDAGTVTTLTHQLAGGVYYTGRTDLTVGALFTATFSSSQTSSTQDDANGNPEQTTTLGAPTQQIGAQITARYFF